MIEPLKHLNEYRRDAVLTPVLVALEAVGELFLTLTIPGRHSRPLLLSHGHRPRDAPHIPPRVQDL